MNNDTRVATSNIEATLRDLEKLQSRYDSLSDEERLALPDHVRVFFEGEEANREAIVDLLVQDLELDDSIAAAGRSQRVLLLRERAQVRSEIRKYRAWEIDAAGEYMTVMLRTMSWTDFVAYRRGCG